MTQDKMPPAITSDLAQWASKLQSNNLPDEVTHQVKRFVLDYFGAVLPGSTMPTSRAAQRYFSSTEKGVGDSGVVGTQLHLAPHTAAFINGTAAHGLEIDDGYTPGSYHPGAACLPAVMAVAQALKSSREDVISAIVVAVEASCRLARAGHPHTWQNGFHNTAINGVFGCALGAGRLRGLDHKKMTWALGLAGSFAGGLFEFLAQGSEVKRLHPGKCAHDGVVVSGLAELGVDGPVTGIEGENGYFKAFAGGRADLDSVCRDLGQTYELLNTYVKPYPCCRHLHAPMDAVVALKQSHSFSAEDVSRIVIQTNRNAAKHNHQHCETLLDAQMSIPYAVAATLLLDDIGLTAFGQQWRNDAGVIRLMGLITVEVSDDMQQSYPLKRPARVIIDLKDGRSLSYVQSQPYGEPDNPLDDEALTRKFRAICDPLLGAELSEQISDACWALDLPRIFALTAIDPRQLPNLLT